MRCAPISCIILVSVLGRNSVTKVEAQHTDRTSSQVALSLDEFEELFSSARLKEAERRLLDQKKMNDAEHRRRMAQLEENGDALARSSEAEARRRRDELFPGNYHVLRHTASGVYNASSPDDAGAEGDAASFRMELTLRVMSPRWTVVPIANSTSVVASNWDVAWRSDGADEGGEYRSVDAVTSPDVMLLLREDQQVLATNRSGLFSVRFTAHTRVSRTRNLNAVGLGGLLYPLSEFSLRIATPGGVTGRGIGDVSVQPTSAVLRVKPSEEGYTDIEATLPLTLADRGIQIRWLDVRDARGDDAEVDGDAEAVTPRKEGPDRTAAPKPQADVGPQVTATHEALHTVGEGILRSMHVLDLTTASEASPINSVGFVVRGQGVRITSVAGHALQSWAVEEGDGYHDDDDVGDSSPQARKVVRVAFKPSNLDSTVMLQVHTEMEHSTGADRESLELPSIECKNVLRQVGHVGVVKEANVEVHERSTRGGLTRCEPTDLSSRLRLNVDRPIVLSYKYLNPQNSIVLDVKKHAAMETLEATLDRVHYKAVVTDTHVAHSLIMVLQSTKLQYLKLLDLPTTAAMFTVAVNSVPAKPVEGDIDNSILVPLLLGLDPEASNEGGLMHTSVEVNYFSKHDALGRNGTLRLAPPHFSLPVSVLSVHLRLPDRYEYEFAGGFGNEPSGKMEYPVPSAFSHKTGKRVVPDDYKFTAVDDAWPEDRELNSKKPSAVKILTPNIGRSFHFHRLLVVDTVLGLNVTYVEPPPQQNKTWLSSLSGLFH